MLVSALVAAQFALIGVLTWLAIVGTLTLWAALFFALGIAIGVWAMSANRPGNFNIQPRPKQGGEFVTTGPYAHIRHPMYLAVMLCAMGAALAAGTAFAWLTALALAIVLTVKAGIEERLMLVVHPAYAAYRARTKAIVPGLL